MSKVNKIIEMTRNGAKAAEIAKKLKTSIAYVYFVRSKSKKNVGDEPKKKARFNSPRSKLIQSVFQTVKDIQPPMKHRFASSEDFNPQKLLAELEAAEKKLDLVNHPPHYKSGGIETIDFIEAKDLNYRLGNVVKYVARAGKKATDPVQDLEKALWYLQREITARKNA